MAGEGGAKREAAQIAADGNVCGAAAGDSSFFGWEWQSEPAADDAAAVAVWVRLRAVQLAGGGSGRVGRGVSAGLAADTDDAGRRGAELDAVADLLSAGAAGAEAKTGGEGEGGAEDTDRRAGTGGGDSGAGAEAGAGDDGGDGGAISGDEVDAAVALSKPGAGAAAGEAWAGQGDVVCGGVRAGTRE